METKAIVCALDGEFALVEIHRRSACDGCHKQQDGHGCAMCALMGENTTMQARAYNPVGAKPGDRVLLATSSARVLGHAALVFLLPLGLALLFYFLGGLLPFGVIGQAISVACGFAGAFAFLWFYSRCMLADRCDVTITRILPHEQERNTPRA